MPRVHPQPVELEVEGTERKLRRLPSVFSRVLELPLSRDADVRVYLSPDADHFVVARGAAGLRPGPVKVRTARLERYGTTRVVVHAGPGEPDMDDDLVYDRWRARLPETAIPSMTVAGFVDGQLVVIVPRGFVDGGEAIPASLVGGGGRRGGGKRGPCGGASLASAK